MANDMTYGAIVGVITYRGDLTLDLVLREIQNLDFEPLVLFIEEYFREWSFSWTANSGNLEVSIKVGHRRIASKSFASIYCRHECVSRMQPNGTYRFHAGESEAHHSVNFSHSLNWLSSQTNFQII